MIKGNALIGQSGGPTSVINSSLAGVIETAKSSSFIKEIYGMHFGIEGFMQEWLYDLGKQSPKVIEGLRHTPSSALGSSRHKVQEKDLPLILAVLKKYGCVSIVCGEGLKYADGTPVSAATVKDKFNNTEFGAMGGTSVALSLHRMITSEFGYRGEFQITESLIMCDFVRSSPVDLDEAYRCGVEAVKLAERGESGFMVSIVRTSNSPYTIEFGKVPLEEVAVSAKPMPKDFFNSEGNHVSPKFIE